MATGRNYKRKGDPFTLKVLRGEGPPTVICWRNLNTGREYFTRVPLPRCPRLGATELGESVREYAQQLCEQRGRRFAPAVLAQVLAFDWNVEASSYTVRHETDPYDRPEVRLRLQPAHIGGTRAVRYYLLCPLCGGRCSAVYASPFGERGEQMGGVFVVGCRTCLGLTDVSRQRHKCPDWQSARLGFGRYSGGRRPWYEGRTAASQQRAHDLFMRSFRRIYKGLGLPWRGA